MRYFVLLASVLTLATFAGCLKATDDRQEVTSGKGTVLSRDEAAEVAAKLANREGSRLFGRTPFSPSDYPAVLIGSRWHWGRHDPAGIKGYSAGDWSPESGVWRRRG